MQSAYRIEVWVSPSVSENPHQPYFWILYHFEKEWANIAAGWSETPTQAWDEAFCFYKSVENHCE